MIIVRSGGEKLLAFRIDNEKTRSQIVQYAFRRVKGNIKDGCLEENTLCTPHHGYSRTARETPAKRSRCSCLWNYSCLNIAESQHCKITSKSEWTSAHSTHETSLVAVNHSVTSASVVAK